MKKNKRETFSSGVAVFFATLGSAVGLGNIWKFPYFTGENGGAAFLIIYLLCVIFVGLPVMISEFYIGRKTRKNVMGAVKKLSNKRIWESIGVLGLVAAYLIMFFYSSVGGWVYSYTFRAIRGEFKGVTKESAELLFNQTTIGPVSPIIWQIIIISVVSLILILGVKSGIERITKTLMPVLLILIVICDIRALTLPGAKAGINFLFKPDFSHITGAVILAALGLAFFKLSIGMGTMVTYSSYFTDDNNLMGTSIKVALADTLVSILAGIAVFPAVFSFGMKPEGGPGLLFNTIPLVFSKMLGGGILLIAFFMLASIASTTAMISMYEVVIAYFTEEKGMSRKKAVIINAIVVIIIGSLASLSSNPKALLGDVTVFGKGFFDVFDWISSNVILPIGGILIAILVGYFVPKEDIKRELSNNGNIKNKMFINIYYFILRNITPILLIIVFLSSIGILKL